MSMDSVDAAPPLPGDGDGDGTPEDDGDDLYDMTHPRRGVAIIINNVDFLPKDLPNREGSDKDAAKLRSMFIGLGFEVEILTNLSCADMLTKMEEVSQQDHRDADCVAVAILTHGDEDGAIYGTDGEKKKLHLLATPLKCQGLFGKPKLFFIQACRGNNMDYGQYLQSDGGDTNMTTPKSEPSGLPQEADVLTAYATVEGYCAWRSPINGSVFVNTLCKEMSRLGKSWEFQHILTRVNKRVAEDFKSKSEDEARSGMRQMSTVEHRLRKQLYFLPKGTKTCL